MNFDLFTIFVLKLSANITTFFFQTSSGNHCTVIFVNPYHIYNFDCFLLAHFSLTL